MKLGQIHWNKKITAAVFNSDGTARPIPDHTVYDLIVRSEKEGVTIQALASSMAVGQAVKEKPLIPIKPREVWACGCTYEMSASFRDAEHNTREGFYAAVYKGDRPEVFFKGTARVCVGPDEPIGIRVDSKFTAPEPELAVILGSGGKVIGYTVANDVSAWDIERENPLYLAAIEDLHGLLLVGSCDCDGGRDRESAGSGHDLHDHARRPADIHRVDVDVEAGTSDREADRVPDARERGSCRARCC